MNGLLADMGSLPAIILSRLFQQYCCSFYGISLCRLQSYELNCMFTVWRKVVRRILRLPQSTQFRMLPMLLSMKHIDMCVETRIF